MMFRLETIFATLGARIRGADLARDPAREFHTIEQALHDSGFIVFPRQTLAPRQLVDFARLWGEPEPHVIDTFHHPEDPNILILSNVHRDGKPIGLVDAGTYFHTDYSYLDVPARCTILYAIQMPRGRQGTTFANQRRAYEDLPDPMKARIDGLAGRHHYGNRNDLDEESRTVASVLNEEQKTKVHWVKHPIVRPHPFTGTRALYAVSGSSFGIEGMSDEEGLALLEELRIHATQPRYCCTYHYEVGDVIVWDNAQLLHCAPLTDLTEARTLWRVTVKEPGDSHQLRDNGGDERRGL
jgi:taurine dioxygenase